MTVSHTFVICDEIRRTFNGSVPFFIIAHILKGDAHGRAIDVHKLMLDAQRTDDQRRRAGVGVGVAQEFDARACFAKAEL